MASYGYPKKRTLVFVLCVPYHLRIGIWVFVYLMVVNVPECETYLRHLLQEVENGTFLSADPDTSPQRLTWCFLKDSKESAC